jgi:hypothetical protein
MLKISSITKVVVLFTTNPTKLSLYFSEFSTNFYAFYKFQLTLFTIGDSLCTGTPRKFQNFTNTPPVHGKHPRTKRGLAIRPLAMGGGDAGQIPASRPRSRPGKRRGTSTGSPRSCWWPASGRRLRRRGRTTETGDGGRSGAASATTRAQPEQQVAPEGSKGSRGGMCALAWPWEAGRAQLDGGGADGAAAGQWRRGEGRAALGFYRRGSQWRSRDDEDAAVARPPRPARLRRRAVDGPAVRGAHRPVRRGPWRAHGREDSQASGHGAWGRSTAWDGGLPRVARPRARKPRRAARAACVTSRCDGALAVFVSLSTCLNTNNSKFLNRTAPNFEYESWRSHTHLQLSQRLYGVFLNRFCRKGLPILNATHLPWIGDTDLWAGFSCFSTQNLRCQSTWKLCPSTSWTTFLKIDFEVFRWNLENAAKVPKDI